jgi:peptidoglycan/xylan/chitin deacetylase (PgdA/CDA1 family)
MGHSLQKLFVDTLSAILRVNGRQRLSVLIYHRVLPQSDYMRIDDPTVKQFDWQMKMVSSHFQPLSIQSALEQMDSGRLPDRAICVTFDDGYADNLSHALPVLEKWGVPATVFVSTSFIDGGVMWNDLVIESFRDSTRSQIDLAEYGLGVYLLDSELSRYGGLRDVLGAIKHLDPKIRQVIVEHLSSCQDNRPKNLMLSSAGVLQLSEHGIEIGAHTHTHPILASVPESIARYEIEKSKTMLESIIDRPVKYFAYPNGKPKQDYTDSHTSMVENLGFQAAFSTCSGVSDTTTDKYQLPRFTPWDKSPDRFMARLLLNARALNRPQEV